MIERQKLRIVVFEDDQGIAVLFEKMLKAFGHKVLIHSNPSSCQIFTSPTHECPNGSPCADVIISDIMMPNMNGIDFLKLQKDRGCKILNEYKALMSASVTYEQKNEIRALGFKFFNKPFNSSDVIEWLKDCGKRKREGALEV